MNKQQKKLDQTFQNTIRSILMYAILSLVLLATGAILHWQLFEYVAIASAIVALIYVIYLVYLIILKFRLKK